MRMRIIEALEFSITGIIIVCEYAKGLSNNIITTVIVHKTNRKATQFVTCVMLCNVKLIAILTTV